MNEVFIGKLIEDELRQQQRSVVWLSQKINCNRTNVYKIFGRQSVDTELLLKISNALKCNFFDNYTSRLTLWRCPSQLSHWPPESQPWSGPVLFSPSPRSESRYHEESRDLLCRRMHYSPCALFLKMLTPGSQICIMFYSAGSGA